MAQYLLLKNADLYAPKPCGICDILLVNGKVLQIGNGLAALTGIDGEIIDCAGRKVIPGYVDQHVHIIGGGGESGFYSRTPEVQLTDIAAAGVTTVIGVIGTDGTSRVPETLLAKARGLDYEGITCYMLTGSYEIPLVTITGDARRDIILLDKVLGIGEIAISDHRSSEPTVDELKRILTQARLGGMLAGKAGVVQFHLGSGKRRLDMLFQVLDESDVPAKHMIPTHVNRDPELFEQAKKFAGRGGYMDITSGVRSKDGFYGGIEPSAAIASCYQEGVPMSQVTMSSDGNGCMSLVLPDGTAKQLVARLNSLHEEVIDAVKLGVPMEVAISTVSENPAKANGLWPAKGTIQQDSDGDMLILAEDMSIDTVIAKGKCLIKDGNILVRGTFEE